MKKISNEIGKGGESVWPNASAFQDRLREQVAQKAYELYEKRGGLHGHDIEDWLEAERLIQAATKVKADAKAKVETKAKVDAKAPVRQKVMAAKSGSALDTR
ncbi:MAG TPA: DUF2934 domain-containing protein [Nitrospiria bacterium]|nr:DUF2934 domain-containing protein [Nitrospiria bacterium]